MCYNYRIWRVNGYHKYPMDIKKIKLEKYVDYLENERNIKLTAQTTRSYKSFFKLTITWFIDNDKTFCRDNIRQFIGYQKTVKKVSAGTINKFITTLSHFGSILEKEEEMSRVHREQEFAKSYDILTDEEQKLLINTHVPCNLYRLFDLETRKRLEEKRNYKYDIVLEVLLKCGLRFGELKYLTWNDWKPVIDTEYGGYFLIRSSKTKRERKVPILNDLAAKINKLPRCPHNYIFGSDRGPIDNHAINRQLKARIQAAGIKKDITVSRRLRTTCGTTMLRHKVPIERVAKKLGNSIKVCYDRYYKEIIDDLVEGEYMHPLNYSQANFNIVSSWSRDLVNKVSQTRHEVKQCNIGNRLIRIEFRRKD